MQTRSMAQAAAELADLKRRAADGQADAQNNLGTILLEGSGGVRQDPKAALRWLTASMEQGNPMAMGNLGYAHLLGKIEGASPEEGVELLRQAVDKGDLQSLCHLAYAYMFGVGVAKDLAEAAVLYQQAAERGHNHAMTILADLCRHGGGLKKDEHKAVKLAHQAAANNYPMAMFLLGDMCEKGCGELAVDVTAAEKWYRNAARLGYPDAQYRLGYIAETGGGIRPPDLNAAVRCYELAAASGHPAATRRMGEMRYYGIGMPKHVVKGAASLIRAAELGDDAAMLAAANLAATGCGGVGLNQTNAAAWLEKAALAGNSMAKFLLGEAYENGYGVPRDGELAREWFSKAAADGNAAAAHALSTPPAPLPQHRAKSLTTQNRELLFSARNGNVQAATSVAYFYSLGLEGFPMSPEVGARWNALAAATGDSYAIIALAGHHAFTAPSEKCDLKKACQMLQPLAEQGNVEAQLMLSDIYFKPEAPGRNPRLTALRWLEAAVSTTNDPAAMNSLANSYFTIALSGMRYWKTSVYKEMSGTRIILASNYRSICKLTHSIFPGRMRQQYFEKALALYHKAADKGHAAAMNSLGDYAFMGFGGVPQDDIAAYNLYRKAEAAGDKTACVNLGVMLLEGWGCQHNTKAGISMLKKAPEIGMSKIILSFYEADKSLLSLEQLKNSIHTAAYFPPVNRATRPIFFAMFKQACLALIAATLLLLLLYHGVPLLLRGLKALWHFVASA